MTTFAQRLRVIDRAFDRITKANEEYLRTLNEIKSYEQKLELSLFLKEDLVKLSHVIVSSEKQWRETVLVVIEREVQRYLDIIYPDDNYIVHLDAVIKYSRVKLQVTVSSNNFRDLKIKSQGTLFKQIVSLASVSAIMKLKGIYTIYVDEAFSGASKYNLPIVGKIIEELRNDGMNLVLIVQHKDIAHSIVDVNEIHITREIGNITKITS